MKVVTNYYTKKGISLPRLSPRKDRSYDAFKGSIEKLELHEMS